MVQRKRKTVAMISDQQVCVLAWLRFLIQEPLLRTYRDPTRKHLLRDYDHSLKCSVNIETSGLLSVRAWPACCCTHVQWSSITFWRRHWSCRHHSTCSREERKKWKPPFIPHDEHENGRQRLAELQKRRRSRSVLEDEGTELSTELFLKKDITLRISDWEI